MDDGDSEQIYAGENGILDDVVAGIPTAANKVEMIADSLSDYGAYEDIDVAVKADIFGLDIADVSGSIRLFSDVMKRLGIRLAGDELYEEFQRIYDESVGRDAGKEKAEDKMWNMGRGDDTSASGRNSLYVPLLLTKYKKIFLRFEKIDYI